MLMKAIMNHFVFPVIPSLSKLNLGSSGFPESAALHSGPLLFDGSRGDEDVKRRGGASRRVEVRRNAIRLASSPALRTTDMG
jgi:hypothetical protein